MEGPIILIKDVPLIFSDESSRRDQLARATARGELVRLARGIYTSDTTTSPNAVVRRHIWPILAHETPGAVISDLSVEDGGTGSRGVIYIVSSRDRSLRLPGLTVLPRPGPGPSEFDTALPGGLWLAGDPRALLDNLAPSRANQLGQRRTGGVAWVERRLDQLCAQRGSDGLNRLRDQARSIAGPLGREVQMRQLDTLIGAALNTRPTAVLATPELRARAAGVPTDQPRVLVFARLAGALAGLAPSPLSELPADADRRALLPFYEAYFSNYIEGTEFTLAEAAAIVFDHVVPPGRPADAHDVVGTYRLTSSSEHMRAVPQSSDGLVELLRARHEILMEGRPEVAPGEFKTRANRAGSTEFVAPELVEGTLRQGFETGAELVDPFARAVYMMFLISEVHPFTDGNGANSSDLHECRTRLSRPSAHHHPNCVSGELSSRAEGGHAFGWGSVAHRRVAVRSTLDSTHRLDQPGNRRSRSVTHERAPRRPRGRRCRGASEDAVTGLG